MKKRLLVLTAALLLCLPAPAGAEAEFVEMDGDSVYSLVDETGAALTQIGARVYADDEYIAGDDRAYRVVSVDDAARTAVCAPLEDGEMRSAFLTLPAQAAAEKRIGMYSTHSDESYVPDDGDYSLERGAGIYDVGNALKDALEKYGIDVEYSQETFLPHDAGAYRRSRRTVEELLKENPDAVFDIHRDAISAEQYETEIAGEDASKVRLFVGRNNPNADANKAFARKLKAAADEKYPGLIKDIFIGKGNYNQELYSQALLLEFGTHEIDKDRAITATRYMADVINSTLYGGGSGAKAGAGTDSAAKGLLWTAGLAGLAAVAYALLSTGSPRGAREKLRRGASEISGGLFGKKPGDGR